MRRFLLHTALFAMLVLATLAIAEAVLRSVPNTYRYKDAWMRANGNSVKTLILGNSLTFEGINPAMMGDSVFNLANSAQLLEHDDYLLRRYAPYQHLQTLIICLGENLFQDELEQVASLEVRSSYYRMYMGHPKHPWWSRYNFELARLDVSLTKWSIYRQMRKQGRTLACDSLGFGPELLAQRAGDWQKRGLGAGWSTVADPIANMERNRPYLVSIAEFCQHAGIRLVVLSMPQWVPSQPEASAHYRAMGAWLSQRYGAHYLDYSADSRFGEQDFFDTRHLNEKGADKFTAILLNDINK